MIEHTCGGRGAVPCPACTVRGAQAAFAADWREQHPDEVFDAAWICPLCNKAVQSFDASTTPKLVIGVHQINHGRAWRDYLSAGQAPGGSGEG